MKLLIKIISVILLLIVAVFFFFAPDILTFFLDGREDTVKKQEIPEVTLTVAAALTPEKKFILANNENIASFLTDKNVHTEEDVRAQVEKIFVDLFLYITGEKILPDYIGYLRVEPKLYIQPENVSSVFWEVNVYIGDEIYVLFVFDDENLDLLRYEIEFGAETENYLVYDIAVYLSRYFNSQIKISYDAESVSSSYGEEHLMDFYLPDDKNFISLVHYGSMIYMNKFSDSIGMGETQSEDPKIYDN